MADPVVKTFNTEGSHLRGNEPQNPEMSTGMAIDIAKATASEQKLTYVGEKGMLDVDPEKIGCDLCQEDLISLRERGH